MLDGFGFWKGDFSESGEGVVWGVAEADLLEDDDAVGVEDGDKEGVGVLEGGAGGVAETDAVGELLDVLGFAGEEAPVLGGKVVFYAEGAEGFGGVALRINANEEEIHAITEGWGQCGFDGFHFFDDEGAGVGAAREEESEDLGASAKGGELHLFAHIGCPCGGEAVEGFFAEFAGG